MQHPGFFQNVGPLALNELITKIDFDLKFKDDHNDKSMVHNVAALKNAGPTDLSFLDDHVYLEDFSKSNVGVCFVKENLLSKLPETKSTVILTPQPYKAFVRAINIFYPDVLTATYIGGEDLHNGELIHPKAKIEDGVIIEPGAIIGAEAHIGAGTIIGPGAVIGRRVTIGRDCVIGPNTTIICSLIGDRVRIYSGASIGQDGFGYVMGAEGHLKVPHIGRVIIQDDVELGANSTIDRGALVDTVIGEGCKLDNLVQVAHNVQMGRHCVIAGCTGISGSNTLGDFVVLGGQVGTKDHIKIGAGAHIAGTSKIHRDVPPGVRYGGTPAKPIKLWFKEILALERLAEETFKSR